MSRTSVKRSIDFDVDESVENASKIAKTNSDGNYWLYLKAETGNIGIIAMQNRSFEKSLAEITKNCPIEMGKVKFFISKGILRINCRNEAQQETLLDLKRIDGHSVTVTLPWALTESNQNDHVFKESKPKRKAFKYFISGVPEDITDDEIKEAANCMEANRISKQDKNKLVQTETVILSFQSEQSLPSTVHFGMLKFKLRAYVPSPVQCKNCLGYGHTSKHCTYQPRCLHCGNVGHSYDACVIKNKAARCANCGGGHEASDKTCPTFIAAREQLRQTAAAKRQTYSRALVGSTNAVATAVVGAPTESAQIAEKLDEIKLDFEINLEKFASQVTNDMQKVLSDFGHEIKSIKTIISDFKNEVETKIGKLEAITEICDNRFDQLVEEKTEMEKRISKLETEMDEVDTINIHQKHFKRYTIDWFQFIIVELCGGIANEPTFKALKSSNLNLHKVITANETCETRISTSYWPA